MGLKATNASAMNAPISRLERVPRRKDRFLGKWSRKAHQASLSRGSPRDPLVALSHFSLFCNMSSLQSTTASTDSMSAINGDSGASSAAERFPAPPRDVLSILRTFLETQQRRVGLWNEYEEAMEGHLRAVRAEKDQIAAVSDGSATGASLTNGHAETTASSPMDHPPASDSGSHPAPPHSHEHGSSHYDSTPLPLSDPGLLARIISLVTSGLLDCAHETRTIALELGSPSTAPEATSASSAPTANGDHPGSNGSIGSSSSNVGPAPFGPRPDLARTIGKIQDLENSVLRKIVRRDQLRRGWVAPPTASEDATQGSRSQSKEEEEEEVQELGAEIERLRKEEIAELMTEVRGEMADLQLGG